MSVSKSSEFIRDKTTPKPKRDPTTVKGHIETVWAAKIKVPARVVVIFTRQLASMVKNAVPILQALDTLSHQVEHPKFGEVIRLTCEKLESGVSFSRCIQYFPRVFPPIFTTMVSIGEQTGALDDALDRLGNWLERDDKLRQRLKSALTYPAFVMVLSTTMTLGLFYTLIPGFVAIFEDMHIELPWITRVVVAITNGLRNPGVVVTSLAVGGLVVTGFRHWTGTKRGMSQFYRFCLRVPIIGTMLTFGSLARYCAAMEALLCTGMDIGKSLKLSAAASGNPLIEYDSTYLINSVLEGNPVGEYMREHPEVYPPTLTNLVASGEESSRLAEMFGRTAGFYDMEMNYAVEALGSAIEPLMLFGVSFVVGTIVLSIFLPMYAYIGHLTE